MTSSDLRWLRPALRSVVLGTIVLLGVQLVLGVVATELLASTVQSFDDAVSRWLVDHRGSIGDALTATASELGHTTTIVVGAVGFGVASLVAGRPKPAFAIGAGLLMELVVFLVVNTVIARPRPALPPLGSVPSTHSFPSGHAAASVVLYFGMTLVAATALSPGATRRVVWVAGTVLAGSVGVARAYRAVHHPTDVLAGWLLGLGCLAVTIAAIGGIEALRARPVAERATHDEARDSTLLDADVPQRSPIG